MVPCRNGASEKVTRQEKMLERKVEESERERGARGENKKRETRKK
jgi:hypothetical protein